MGDHPIIVDHVRWMRQRNQADSTRTYRRIILRALFELGDLDAVTHRDILDMFDARGICPSTKNVWRSHLRSFYRWARLEGLVTVDPMDRIDKMPQPQLLPRPITETDLTRALGHGSERMRLWVTLGAYAGLRCCEISALRAENIGRDTRTIRVLDSKHGGSRIVPMHARVIDCAGALPAHGALWQINRKGVSSQIRAHFARLDMAWGAHSLRHRFGTVLWETTRDLNIVADLMGHRSIETTRVYTRIGDVHRREAIDGIA